MEDALPASAAAEASDAQREDYFKLRCLTKYVSSSVYEYFSDIEKYAEAINILDKLYMKKKNEIFQRHLLAKRQ